MKYIPPLGGDPEDDWVDANPALGVQGSVPERKIFFNPQTEIMNVIIAAGLVPNDADLTQLYQAINTLITDASISPPDASEIEKGIVELANSSEALGGIDTTRAVTSAGLASSQSLTSNGFIKLPGGLIIQWGIFTFTSVGTANTFPLTFPTACKALVPGVIGSASVNMYAAISSPTTTGFIGYLSGSSSTATVFCVAIGY